MSGPAAWIISIRSYWIVVGAGVKPINSRMTAAYEAMDHSITLG
jgi:hypothetical protein